MLKEFKNEIDVFLDKVKSFAVNDLGCGCEDYIFEQLRVLRGEASPGNSSFAMVLGERLLVLFADYDKLQPFDYEIPRLILSGITYRDSLGLNRFRLVLSDRVTDEHRERIDRELAKYDDKVHVHYMG
jgi:hypothetical protein